MAHSHFVGQVRLSVSATYSEASQRRVLNTSLLICHLFSLWAWNRLGRCWRSPPQHWQFRHYCNLPRLHDRAFPVTRSCPACSRRHTTTSLVICWQFYPGWVLTSIRSTSALFTTSLNITFLDAINISMTLWTERPRCCRDTVTLINTFSTTTQLRSMDPNCLTGTSIHFQFTHQIVTLFTSCTSNLT